jgi:hypothetical protein
VKRQDRRHALPATYQIEVLGRLDAKWAAWFADMTIGYNDDVGGVRVTTLTGVVPDQSALHGLLGRIRDLNLPLLSVTRLDANLAQGDRADE